MIPTSGLFTSLQGAGDSFTWTSDDITGAGVSAALAPPWMTTRNGTIAILLGTGVRGSNAFLGECTCRISMSANLWFIFNDLGESKKKMTDKYVPRNEMKKLEANMDHESDRYDVDVGGLPDMIYGNIVASKPKTMQEAIEMATELMDKRVSTMAERQAKNKRKFESTSRNNQNQQQQQNKRQNTGRAYTAGSGDKKPYGGSRPLCSKCNYHHDGPCAPKCYKCNKYGHIARDCRGTGNANNINNQKGTGSGQKPTCFECGAQGHFKKDCPRMKNNKGNHGNQAGNDRAPAKVYVVGNAGANPDNVVAAQKYMEKGFPVFLAHITAKEVEDKSEEKRLEDVPIVQDFPEVFPEDLPGLPLTRQVEFQIDLVPGVAPVARAPY
ncbi:putative reverse transcriptase domain-containing protein [Tanacetum coccineum]